MKKLFILLFLLLIPLQLFAAAISTLTDNFNDNSIDTAKWDGYGFNETNQELEAPSGLGGTYSDFWSINNYDFTGSSVTIKIVDAGNQSLASWHVIIFVYGVDNYATWRIKAGIIKVNDGGNFSTTYVANTFRYLRIRESGGNTYWDYSATGLSGDWTNATSQANYFNITSCSFYIQIRSNAEASTTVLKVDDFNILPSSNFFEMFN